MATSAQLARDHAYREEHPEIVPVLAKARRLIPLFFGTSISLVLDVLIDPEEPEARTLIVLIQTSLEPDEALPLLDTLNDRWWRTASAALDADVHFGLDYV